MMKIEIKKNYSYLYKNRNKKGKFLLKNEDINIKAKRGKVK